jgi:hypothetical protein
MQYMCVCSIWCIIVCIIVIHVVSRAMTMEIREGRGVGRSNTISTYYYYILLLLLLQPFRDFWPLEIFFLISGRLKYFLKFSYFFVNREFFFLKR